MDKSFLLKMAEAATKKYENQRQVYARAKERVKVSKETKRLPDGSILIPSNMSGEQFKKLK